MMNGIKHGGHLLLVEDDDLHARMIRFAFGDGTDGFTLDRVANGTDALKYLRAQEPFAGCARPDAVLLDLRLPGLDGFDVLHEVREDDRLRDLCVIVLSTSSAPGDVQRARRLRADHYITKPSSYGRLCETVRQIKARCADGHAADSPREAAEQAAFPRGDWLM